MTIYVIFKELQNEHGFVDTDILAAALTEAEAEAIVEEYKTQGLEEGERVCGREWAGEESDWTTNYSFTKTDVVQATREVAHG